MTRIYARTCAFLLSVLILLVLPLAEASAGWSSAGVLATARYDHTATLLPNGKVLIVGGVTSVGGFASYLASAELYDPATNSWSSAASMGTARRDPTATLLQNGKVLVVGGLGPTAGMGALATAELYDPATDSWSSAGNLAERRWNHTATLLPSGKVRVVGGGEWIQWLASAEVYDPATNTWSSGRSPSIGRYLHTATMLGNGKELVVGGSGGNYFQSPHPSLLASAELYDEATDTVSGGGSLATPRDGPTATLLADGDLLLAGGSVSSGSVASAEAYHPATNDWSGAGTMTTARVLHTATLLPSGRVLVAGGYKSPNLLSSAETYNPATGSWSTVASMDSPRSLHTATLLPSGRVLVAGGGLVSTFIASAELYEPDPDSTGPQPGGGTQPSGGGTQPSGGGTQPSGGEGVGPIPDTSPAVVATSVRAQKLAAVLKKGLALTVTANEAAALRVELLLDRRVATRLGLRARIGTATVRIFAAGKVAVKVKLSRTARRKLAARRRVRLKVSVRATDAAGNQTVRTRTVTLRR